MAVDVLNATRFMNAECDQLTEVRSLSMTRGGREIRDAADNDESESIIEAIREPWNVTVETRKFDEIWNLEEAGGFVSDTVVFTVYGRKKLEEVGDPGDMTLTFTGAKLTSTGDNGAWGDLRTATVTFFASELVITSP